MHTENPSGSKVRGDSPQLSKVSLHPGFSPCPQPAFRRPWPWPIPREEFLISLGGLWEGQPWGLASHHLRKQTVPRGTLQWSLEGTWCKKSPNLPSLALQCVILLFPDVFLIILAWSNVRMNLCSLSSQWIWGNNLEVSGKTKYLGLNTFLSRWISQLTIHSWWHTDWKGILALFADDTMTYVENSKKSKINKNTNKQETLLE